MKQEVTVTGKTVEAAVAAGAEQLGASASSVTYEVLEAPKKGFLGFGETPARVRVVLTSSPEMTALSFIKTVISDMGIQAEAAVSGLPGGKREYLIRVTGEDASVLIGHHGETLDALQYLANLAANRHAAETEEEYTRIALDVGDYRAKREETLRRLARRMAEKALKYRKNITLEPMNPYERRIIHSEVQNIAGVTTSSTGADNNRRVVIYYEGERRTSPVKTSEAPKEYRPYPKNKIQKRARFDESLPEYHAGDALSEDAEIDRAEAAEDTDEI